MKNYLTEQKNKIQEILVKEKTFKKFLLSYYLDFGGGESYFTERDLLLSRIIKLNYNVWSNDID